MAELTDIADAVVAELNAEDWDLDFTAVRRNLPWFDGPPTDLQVVVVPRGREKTLHSRSENEVVYTIEIGVRRQLTGLKAGQAASNTDTDPLIGLLQDIDDHFDAAQLAGYTAARWQSTEWAIHDELLRENHLFAATLTVAFRVLKTR